MEAVAASPVRTVGDLVRSRPALALVLGDAGIGPRYVAWTLAEAARDRGVRIEDLLALIG